MLTPTVLKKILPNCDYPEKWVRPLNDTMLQFEIDTPQRVAAFLAQIAVESQELNVLEENLSYAPGRLTAVWPHRFPNAEMARPYSRNPEKLANAVYANRLGNGDEASRDGYRFRGRGLIQVTGRANYAEIGEALDIDLINMPDTLLEPKYAALSAGVFWAKHGLGDIASIDDISRKVNGGEHGLGERRRYYKQALEVLGGVTETVADRVQGVPVSKSIEASPSTSESWFE